jgi:acyl-CoA reductase-like NAD-dependent aldehyde dehydrogenase
MTATITASADLTSVTDRARAAQRAWDKELGQRRLQLVKAFRHLLFRDADRLADCVCGEVGKRPEEVLGGEILPTADACRFLERNARKLLRRRRVSIWSRPAWMFGQTGHVYRQPRGVVGIIGTWNYPLFLNGVQIMQALAAGNAVVWKPSEVTPRFAELLESLFREAGFPPDLLQRLPATREMGPALAEADVDHVVFTGSAAVGRKLAARLGERLISSTLELSGCDAMFVLPDADVRLAARAAWFGMTVNRGQTCIAVRRAFVHRSRYGDFCDLLRPLISQAAAMPLTLPSQARQVDHFVQDAVARGGKPLVDRLASSGAGCFPTVLIDATPEMAVCREAAFAPVMAVLPFDDVQQALTMERECPYALAASIFSESVIEARWLVANELRAGAVSINDVVLPTAHPATPFGGSGASGWGVTQGAEGLLEMTVPQVVSTTSGKFRPHYDMGDLKKLESQGELLRGFLQAGHAPGLFRRLAGWWRIVRAAMRGV